MSASRREFTRRVVRVVGGAAALPGYVAAAALAFVAPVGLAVVAAQWRAPAGRVPVHWGGGGADNFEASSTLFWSALLPSLITAVFAAGMAMLLDEYSGRRSTAAAFGALVLFGAAWAMQWPVSQLTAADPSLNNNVGAPFLLYLSALPLAGLAWVVASLRPHHSLTEVRSKADA